MDILEPDHAARIRFRELQRLHFYIVVFEVRKITVLYSILFADGDLVAVCQDRPRFEIRDLGVLIEIDVSAAVFIASLRTEQPNGRAMKGLNFAIVLHRNLRFIEQDHGRRIFVVIGEFFLGRSAEPIGGGVRRRSKRSTRRDECGCSQYKRSSSAN